MSLWWKRKDKQARTHYYEIPFAPFALVAMIGILIAVILPLLQALRAWIGG